MKALVLCVLALALGGVWAVEETAVAGSATEAVATAQAQVQEQAKAEVSTESESGAEAEADAESEAALMAKVVVESEAEIATELAADIKADAELEAAGKSRPINCMDAKARGLKNKNGGRGSGVYRVKPLDGGEAFNIWCDMRTEGGGYNVFVRRFDGSVDFYRPWADYKRGFGTPRGEYFLGLDKLHRLSKTMPHKLRIELLAFDGQPQRYGTWRTFMIDDESKKYRLTARGFRDGGIGNSLRYHSGRPFSTYDRDNDAWANNCASYFHGAWWYGACHNSNLFGKYYRYPGKHPRNYADGADWLTYKGHFESYKRVTMKFK